MLKEPSVVLSGCTSLFEQQQRGLVWLACLQNAAEQTAPHHPAAAGDTGDRFCAHPKAGQSQNLGMALLLQGTKRDTCLCPQPSSGQGKAILAASLAVSVLGTAGYGVGTATPKPCLSVPLTLLETSPSHLPALNCACLTALPKSTSYKV